VTNLAERSVLSDRAVAEALVALHRAVAAHQFYPDRHPMLLEALKDGFRAMSQAQADYRWEEPGLQLRSGALWFGHSRLGEGSPAVGTLARTFSGHGLALLRRRGEVTAEAYAFLVSLLAASPDVLGPRGGLAEAWKRSPFAGVWELQGLAVRAGGGTEGGDSGPGRSREGDWGAGLAPGVEADLLADPRLFRRLQAFQQKGSKEKRLLDLLLGLGRTQEMPLFLEKLREIARELDGYAEGERYREAYQVVLFLYREAQNMEAEGQEGKRDYLLDTIRLAVKGPLLQWVIELVATGKGDEEEAELGEYVLRTVGKAAVVPAINALVSEGSRLGRRRLVDVLVSIGDAAVPWAVKMLDDQRWFVVRNMVTVLGGIGTPEAQRALARLAEDGDGRIRREVARALGRMSGPGAQEQVLRLLGDPEPAVRLLAISAAAGYPSEHTLGALVALFRRAGTGAADWNVRAAVLRSLGRLGLPGGVDLLAEVLGKRPWFRRKRWHDLKRSAIQALGDLGGERSVALLTALKEHRDVELRTEAARALAAAEKR
jgi:hypothetical protein